MQTNLKALALAAAVLSTSLAAPLAAQATEPVATIAQPTTFAINAFRSINPLKIRLHVENKAHQVLNVVLRNEQGQALYTRALSKHETGKAFAFDLSELPDGPYTVEVSSKSETLRKTFDLTTPDRTLALK